MTGATVMTTKNERLLIEILEREVEIYEQLLEIKAREKEALIAFSTAELESCTRAQDSLVGEAAELEYRRRSVVRTLAEANQHQGEDPTLREVAEWISTKSSDRVEILGEALREIFTEIARLQDSNVSLIHGATTYIHKTVDDLISKRKQDPFAYGKSGAKATLKETMPGLLDRKA